MSGVEHKAEKENKGELGLACFFCFLFYKPFLSIAVTSRSNRAPDAVASHSVALATEASLLQSNAEQALTKQG